MNEKKCIIRCNYAGVFFGVVAKREGQEAELRDVRRIWYWAGAATLSQLAMEGTKKPDECKFTMAVPVMTVTDVIEVIPCTEEAVANIEAVPVWKI